ncbi:unnamed protein product [Mytilus edulis]|uniref:Uncharacterized protein n=1 Tax=Mytilus edulis TaxID=6550 RepID=A0A8S3V7W9_MYTED|nr:unnamed protein product [Mytilus edulis]
MKLTSSADYTHTVLRIATCFLHSDVKEDCLKIIQTVTVSANDHLLMQNYLQFVKQTLTRTYERFVKFSSIFKTHEIAIYNRIIKQDLNIQDPYKTIEQIEQFKKEGYEISECDVLTLVWERCWFDVTFMTPELPILPKPAALELCIDRSQKNISFHPFLYGLLLEFLWHVKNNSINGEREKLLKKMKNCISMIPDEQKSRGLNFITYCLLITERLLLSL